jgi:hypothetical protein
MSKLWLRICRVWTPNDLPSGLQARGGDASLHSGAADTLEHETKDAESDDEYERSDTAEMDAPAAASLRSNCIMLPYCFIYRVFCGKKNTGGAYHSEHPKLRTFWVHLSCGHPTLVLHHREEKHQH